MNVYGLNAGGGSPATGNEVLYGNNTSHVIIPSSLSTGLARVFRAAVIQNCQETEFTSHFVVFMNNPPTLDEYGLIPVTNPWSTDDIRLVPTQAAVDAGANVKLSAQMLTAQHGGVRVWFCPTDGQSSVSGPNPYSAISFRYSLVGEMEWNFYRSDSGDDGSQITSIEVTDIQKMDLLRINSYVPMSASFTDKLLNTLATNVPTVQSVVEFSGGATRSTDSDSSLDMLLNAGWIVTGLS